MLAAHNLSKQFVTGGATVHALADVSLSVNAGDVVCLLGANGAGKTTTINCFLGFIAPTSGTAMVNGVDVAKEPIETKRHLAYIPETVMLYRNLTGTENLAYFAELALGRRVSKDELRGFLRSAGLPPESDDRAVGSYSKGMRQKVGIALALAKNATALLLDEPTSGLDPKASSEFSALLAQLAARGAGVLMATHDLFRAKESGTHVVIMKHGRIVAIHRTSELTHADLEQLYLQHMRD
ncbi:MAG: ABC transporter ATP-binding protein [Phycisphaerae bacterium]|nr:ABC transporter ATP-binding protein [Gemmatimonadaceae bacterium]